MKKSELTALMGALAPVIHEHVEKIAQPLRDRITELEAKPELRYAGTWSDGKSYPVGSVVTDGGSMWHANTRTAERPGTSESWTLCVKRGRDGRDGGAR